MGEIPNEKKSTLTKTEKMWQKIGPFIRVPFYNASKDFRHPTNVRNFVLFHFCFVQTQSETFVLLSHCRI